MKAGIHPEYRYVVFKDNSVGHMFRVRSTVKTRDTVVWAEDGQTYPAVNLDVSDKSHPFYTGKSKVMDVAGRIDKFKRRYGSK